jgi:hypothetical protein
LLLARGSRDHSLLLRRSVTSQNFPNFGMLKEINKSE